MRRIQYFVALNVDSLCFFARNSHRLSVEVGIWKSHLQENWIPLLGGEISLDFHCDLG